MSRDLTSGMTDAIVGVVVRPVLLVEGQFIGGSINWWTGVGELSYDSKTWQGVGDLLGVSAMEETGEIKASGITVSLSGVKTEKMSLALSEMRRGMPGKIWLALLNEAGEVIDAPKIMFRGRLDTCTVEDGGDTSTISLAYEHELIDLERAREVRYTSEEQRREFSDDAGLDNIAALQDATIPWGGRT